MTRKMMTSLLIAGAILVAATGASRAAVQFWVVGNLVTNSCDIVSQNPVVNPLGPVWFGTGPFKSHDDAKAARSGISACPRVD
ncbi:MAG: putative exported protein of unknown function [Tardiphaga sp.]|jgi:hypothetical protein|nr:putative exported protein of unknown function [Tardiphaga sp.]MDB5573133.1 putative exported protein of unknown function [Tardiphaga sp.]MDB5627454.1 putative exported protein of unknown function [Tardiphaga sp.]MDB5629492.1 putative exported protein of unknown function [Tardiphaga sp.]